MLTDEQFERAYEHLTYEMLWCIESRWFGYEAVTYARRLYRLLEQNGKIPSTEKFEVSHVCKPLS